MPDKYDNKYRISSARLPAWNYSSNAAYFITVCSADRHHYFGEIINGEMQLTEIGKKANQYWLDIPNHFPYVLSDEFVVMPNHIHGVIIIDKPYNGRRPDSHTVGHLDKAIEIGSVVETGHALSLQSGKQPHARFRNQGKNTISSMTGSFKSAVTKYCNENKLPFRWQSRFHDHIIRDKNELFNIRNYIINNVSNWKEDVFFTP